MSKVIKIPTHYTWVSWNTLLGMLLEPTCHTVKGPSHIERPHMEASEDSVLAELPTNSWPYDPGILFVEPI